MQINAAEFIKPLHEISGTNEYILCDISSVVEYKNGVRGTKIIALKYTVANPKTFARFDVKVAHSTPLIDATAINPAENPTWVVFENAFVKPYKIEYGKALCSVTAEDIKFARQK